jgi:methionyl-tRNA formyltransferase
MASGQLAPVKQDDSLSNYAPKISKQEAAVDWHQPAIAIERKIRAFNPFPVAHCPFNGNALRLWRGQAITQPHQAAPGTILEITGDAIRIACGEGALDILEAQLPGKKRLPTAEILRGHSQLFAVGQRLDSAH